MGPACDQLRRAVLEELFTICWHGRGVTLAEARRMPVPVRNWWWDRVRKQIEEQNKET